MPTLGKNFGFKYGNSNPAGTAITDIISISIDGVKYPVVEYKTLDASLVKALLGLPNPGNVSVEYYFSAAQFATLEAIKAVQKWALIDLETSGNITFQITMFEHNFNVDDADGLVVATATFRVDSIPTVTAGS